MLGPANRSKFFEAEAASNEVRMAARLFACCHSLEFVEETHKVDGDPVEVELFKFGPINSIAPTRTLRSAWVGLRD